MKSESLLQYPINEETQSLLLVEERAQTIYKRKRSYVQDTGLTFVEGQRYYRLITEILLMICHSDRQIIKRKIVFRGFLFVILLVHL